MIDYSEILYNFYYDFCEKLLGEKSAKVDN